MAKVLISEKINPVGAELLRARGHQVVQMETIEEAELAEKIRDAEALLVRILPVTGALMESAPRLRIISKHGVGVDNIDLKAAKELGIAVTTAPDANGLSVAEHTMALLLGLAKNLVPVSRAYKEIGFAAKNYREGVEISGKTLGIIGCGRIGSRVAAMAGRGFGMKVLVYDPYISSVPEGAELVSNRDRVFREADFLTLHCYLSDETFHCVGEREFSMMKKGAYLVNASRGPVVDEEAMILALKSGKLAGAGLDVTEREPLDPESPLFSMENVIVTPHYAPATQEAARKVAQIAAENIAAFFAGGELAGRIV